MKSFRLSAFVVLALLSACSRNQAVIEGTVAGYPSSEVILKQFDGTVVTSSDTVKTDGTGRFVHKVEVQDARPEFVYVYKGDTRLASLLLEKGETVKLAADTLGSYSVEGSAGSALLKEGDDNFRIFQSELYRLAQDPQLNRKAVSDAYLTHYKKSVRFVLENCKSLASVPVLYEKVGGISTFSGVNDALLFRSVCDSLKTVYPDSRYVKALEAETQRRERLFELSLRMKNATERAYPVLEMPSMNGKTVNLDSLDAKAVLVYFWDDREPTHKMFNIDVLKPLYEKYSSRGLEIYAVCINPDKTSWGQTVMAQGLPWVNVNDGLGSASRSLAAYNVRNVPAFYLVSDTGLVPVSNRKRLGEEIERLL